MTSEVIEWAAFRLRADKTEADLVAASDAFQQAFLEDQPGFLSREIIRTGEGAYADLVHWRSRKDADAVAEKMFKSEACAGYLGVMDLSGGAKPLHYASVKAYR